MLDEGPKMLIEFNAGSFSSVMLESTSSEGQLRLVSSGTKLSSVSASFRLRRGREGVGERDGSRIDAEMAFGALMPGEKEMVFDAGDCSSVMFERTLSLDEVAALSDGGDEIGVEERKGDKEHLVDKELDDGVVLISRSREGAAGTDRGLCKFVLLNNSSAARTCNRDHWEPVGGCLSDGPPTACEEVLAEGDGTTCIASGISPASRLLPGWKEGSEITLFTPTGSRLSCAFFFFVNFSDFNTPPPASAT